MAKRKQPAREERLTHILAAIEDIFLFTEHLSFEEFLADRKTRLAVEKLFEIIGEASYKIDLDFKVTHPDVEWEQMEKTRHILVHNYYEIVPKILWDIRILYLPDLHAKLRRILADM